MMFYRVGLKRKWSPFFKTFKTYRHEVEPENKRLIIYTADNGVLSLPMDWYAWKVYPEYWEVTATYQKMGQIPAQN